MFKLIKKIPLNYDGICLYNNEYLLLKDNIITFYDKDFNKLKDITLTNNFKFITAIEDTIFLANEKEIYKYDFNNLIKLDINLDIININNIDNTLAIITTDKVYLYDKELKEYSNVKCSNIFNIDNKKYFIKKNDLYDNKKIQ